MTEAQTRRAPTPDELAGIGWWNGLSKEARKYWLNHADTAVPAVAWAAFKLAQAENVTHDAET
jgi:hypothetical protein